MSDTKKLASTAELNQRRFISPRQFAHEIGMDYHAILRHCRAGKFPTVRFGERMLIDRIWINEWLRSGSEIGAQIR